MLTAAQPESVRTLPEHCAHAKQTVAEQSDHELFTPRPRLSSALSRPLRQAIPLRFAVCPLAVARREEALAKPDVVRGDLDELVVFDILERAF